MNRAIKSALALVLLLTSYTALWADAQLPPVPPASSSVAGKAKCDGTTTLCDTDGTMHATNGGSVGITQATGDVTTPASSTGSTVFTIGALKVITAYINDLAVTTAKIADGAITTAKHAANAVTNAVLAQMPAHTFKGNNTGSTANALDLTTAQLTAELNVYTTLLQGEVPASVTNNHSKVLWDDGWGTAPAGGGGGSVSVTAGTPNIVITPSPGTGTFTVGSKLPISTPADGGSHSYTVQASDITTCVELASTYTTLVVPQATGSFGAGAQFCVITKSTITATSTTSTVNGIAGATGLKLGANSLSTFTGDGADWRVDVGVPTVASQGGTTYLKDDGTYGTPGGAGTVTQNGNLTTNAFVQGGTNGTSDIKTVTAAAATAALNAVVGDSGSGGTKGLVPAPASGDAAAGKFLKADGTFAVPAGGGGSGALTLVSTVTFSGSASATWNTLTGKDYRLVCRSVLMASAANIKLQFGQSGTFDTGAHYSIQSNYLTGTTGTFAAATGINGAGANALFTTPARQTSIAGDEYSMTAEFTGLADTGEHAMMWKARGTDDATAARFFIDGHAWYTGNTSAITDIRVIGDSGTSSANGNVNFSSGTCSLYAYSN
jgi:hypothetical protein